MSGAFIHYLTFMGDLFLGVAMWIAPGALAVIAYKLWRKWT